MCKQIRRLAQILELRGLLKFLALQDLLVDLYGRSIRMKIVFGDLVAHLEMQDRVHEDSDEFHMQ